MARPPTSICTQYHFMNHSKTTMVSVYGIGSQENEPKSGTNNSFKYCGSSKAQLLSEENNLSHCTSIEVNIPRSVQGQREQNKNNQKHIYKKCFRVSE